MKKEVRPDNKKKVTKSLKLSKETLASLSSSELYDVKGGVPSYGWPLSGCCIE